MTGEYNVWTLAAFIGAFIELSDVALRPRELVRVMTPVIIGVWLAIASAYISTVPATIVILLMSWSIIGATAFGMSPLYSIAPSTGFLVYFVIMASQITADLTVSELLLSLIAGTAWSVLIMLVSSVIAGESRGVMNLPPRESIKRLIRDNFTLHSRYFVFALARGGALTIGLLYYLATGDRGALWISITILVVMIPDKNFIWKKVGDRILGTILGVIFVIAFFTFLSPGFPALILTLISLFVLRAFAGWPYSLVSFLVTVMVLSMMAMFTGDVSEIGSLRIVDTLIGVAIALLMSYLFVFWVKESSNGQKTQG